MRAVRRGLLALMLALLAVLLAPSTPAVSPSPGSVTWSVRSQVTRRPYVAGVPLSLTIPRLGVATDVVPAAVEAGVLAPPADPALVGWWSGGARPGSRRGAVLLTGHTVHPGGGVFDDLALLEPGDALEVGTRGGPVAYVVVTVRDLSKAELAGAAVDLFAASGRPRLVLVTCTDWDAGRYLGNTVVVGVPAGP